MSGNRNTGIYCIRYCICSSGPFADKKRGDALYFPGHIALYLGEGRYIHSTGAYARGGVVINSLDPADPLYREDLVRSLYAVGSVF